MIFPDTPDMDAERTSVKLIWDHVESALSSAEVIVFIGYSLPNYDSFAAQCLRRHASGKEIEVYTGINFLAFRQSKMYIRFDPSEHNVFSERVIGSEPPFQKSSKPVVATDETGFSDTTSFGVFPGIAISSSPQPVALPCADRESRHPLLG